MSYQQLTKEQRYQMSLLFAEKYSAARIAEKLNVHRSTVYRERNRNSRRGQYEPGLAHRLTQQRRRTAGKARVPEHTILFVEFGLAQEWSPEQISAIGAMIDIAVSHEWIYRYVASDKARGGTLYKSLRQGKKRYRRGANGKRSPIPDPVSIDERPAIVESRERLGDWEADTVLGKQGTGALVTLAERKSRKYLVKRVKSKEAGVVKDAIIEMLSPYRDHVHTITFDNGGEFAEHKAIAEALDAKAFFAHAYSSWERGLNENFNGLLRQYIPKGTNLRELTDKQIERIERRLNLRPRKCLGFKQPEIVFEELRQAA
jgi:IS30 family transposase